MKKTAIVTCIGELIVDFHSTAAGGRSLRDAVVFRRSAGGAPANVAVGLARLGVRSAFVGRVGDDPFGRSIVGELRRAGVGTGGVVFDAAHRTRLAFVTVGRSGDREFEFWEEHPADEQLRLSDVDRKALAASAIVHVSSFLLLNEASRSAALAVAWHASRSGCVVSFDPNLRLPLWTSPAEARRVMLEMIRLTGILRLNADEARFLTRERRIESAARRLASFGPSLVAITRGGKGTYLHSSAGAAFIGGYPVRAVDTTGCGDGFLAGLLAALAASGRMHETLLGPELVAVGKFANAVGALTAMNRGAIPALPTLAAVRAFLRARHR